MKKTSRSRRSRCLPPFVLKTKRQQQRRRLRERQFLQRVRLVQRARRLLRQARRGPRLLRRAQQQPRSQKPRSKRLEAGGQRLELRKISFLASNLWPLASPSHAH